MDKSVALAFEIAETTGGFYVTVYVKGEVDYTAFRATRSAVESYIVWRLKEWVLVSDNAAQAKG